MKKTKSSYLQQSLRGTKRSRREERSGKKTSAVKSCFQMTLNNVTKCMRVFGFFDEDEKK